MYLRKLSTEKQNHDMQYKTVRGNTEPTILSYYCQGLKMSSTRVNMMPANAVDRGRRGGAHT